MEKIRLKEICDLQNGYAFKSKDYIEKSNTLNCRMSNIRPGAVFDIEYSPKYLPDEFIKKYEEFILKDGDIVIAMTDLAGDPKILGVPAEVNTKGKNVLLNQRVGKLIIKNKEKIYYSYLKYVLSNPANKEYYKKFAGGGLQLNISKKDILNLEIPIYEINQQIEISNKLDKVQEIIDFRKKQIQELDELIKSQFVEMFGDPILNSMNWEVKKLKDISNKIMSGNTPKGGDRVYVSSGIEFYRSQNVWKNRIEKEDIAYIDEETHKKMIKSSLKHNDLLITKTGRINTENSSLGRTAIYTGEDDKANINGHVYLVRLNEGENHEFVLRILISDRYREHIRSVCVGGIDKRQLNKEHIEDFPIIYPPKELQKKFTDKVKQIDKQKFEIQKSLEETQKLQESLMNKYFG